LVRQRAELGIDWFTVALNQMPSYLSTGMPGFETPLLEMIVVSSLITALGKISFLFSKEVH